MAPTKPTKPTTTGEKKPTSLFASLKKDPALAKAFDKAKTTPPNGRDYEGPDGDLVCRLHSYRSGAKNGIAYACLEFRILGDYDGQGEYDNQKLVLYFSFEDKSWETKEDTLAAFFDSIAKMGIDVTSLTDTQIEEEIRQIAADKIPILISVKWSKDGKYPNPKVKEPVEGESSGEDTSSPENSSGGDAGPVPSEWENYTAKFSFKRGPKKLEGTYWISNPNDDARTIDLIDEDSNVVHEGVSIDDENLVLISE